MPTTDAPAAVAAAAPGPAAARRAPPLVDASFARAFALVNGGVPLAVLAYDAARGQLGVNGANYAIRTTGILGLTFLLLSLLVTPLRELTGWSVLIAARRRVGVYAFVYLALHFALFFLFDRAGSVRSTLEEIVSRTYLQIGAVALLLFVPLAVTSTDAMVQRLGARRWKALHRLTYLATTLGAIHYYLLVKSDRRQPIAYLIALATLLCYRAVRHYLDLRERARRAPARAATAVGAAGVRAAVASPSQARARPRFWKGELVVAKVFDESPDVRTFRLTAPGGGPLPFDYEPGQYMNLALQIDGRPVRRSYTIASSPTRRDYCELTIKRKADGYASRHLHATLAVGSTLAVAAPAGRFVFDPSGATRVVLIAGGVGITPVMSMLRALTDRCWPGEIHFVFSARTQADVVFREELAYLAKRFANLRVTVALSNEPDAGWTGERGRLNAELLARVLPPERDAPVYLCGPEGMMDATRAHLEALGFARERVFTEAFVSPAASSDARDGEPTGSTDAPPGARPADEARDDDGGDAGQRLVTIRFATARARAEATRADTVLEAAEGAGVSIPFECRSGICGQCKVRLLRGTVAMDADDALTPADRKAGRILACQAHATADEVVVEA